MADESFVTAYMDMPEDNSQKGKERIGRQKELGGAEVSRQGATVFDQQVGERAKHIREILSMTMQEVADQLGVTRQTLGSYESGLTPMRADVVRSLCEVYRVPSSWMLGMTDGLHCKWKRGGRMIELNEQSKHIESPIQEQKDEVE